MKPAATCPQAVAQRRFARATGRAAGFDHAHDDVEQHGHDAGEQSDVDQFAAAADASQAQHRGDGDAQEQQKLAQPMPDGDGHHHGHDAGQQQGQFLR